MKTFQEFLENKHAEQCQGLDDEMPDAQNDWFENLDVQEVIDYAEEWGEAKLDDMAEEINTLWYKEEVPVDNLEEQFNAGVKSYQGHAKEILKKYGANINYLI